MMSKPALPVRMPRRRRKEARPSELAEAALELFVEKGYAATRLEDVAAKAGVSKGTVYLYFANKEALFDGVIRQAILPALERGEARVQRHRGSAQDLLRDILVEWTALLENTTLGRIPKVVAADADKFPDLAAAFHEAVIARGSRLLQAVITRGVRRGEFRPVPVEATAEVLLSSLMMPAIARRSPGFHSGTPVPADQYLSALVELALHGLLSPGRSGQ